MPDDAFRTQFVETMTTHLEPHGYVYKRGGWWAPENDFQVVLYLQRSAWGEGVYINTCVYFEGVPQGKRISTLNADASVRVEEFIGKHESPEWNAWQSATGHLSRLPSSSTIKRKLKPLLNDVVVPFVSQLGSKRGYTKAAHKHRLNHLLHLLKAKKALGMLVS